LLVAAIALGVLVGGCGEGGDASVTPVPSPTTIQESSATSEATPVATPTVEAAPSLTISAVGDISLAREVVPRMETNGALYPYMLISHLLTGDVVFANLEGALTERGEPWPKGYNFRTPPRFASGLRDAGLDIVSLANNHTMDFGVVGLEDTLDALDAASVRRIGAGRTGIEAAQPAVLEANGLRVAFIGCAATPVEAGGFAIQQWSAEADGTGVFVCDDAALRTWIAEARKIADFVIVTAHAGTEYRNAPDATQSRIVNVALEAGADVFIGHHAHVVQPVELRGNQLVAWGLGNFIFDLDNVDLANIPEPRVSLVLNFTLTKGKGVTSWEAVSVVQDANEDRPRPANAEEAAILQDLVTP
jgi:poly-gamma-glutamate synthesis protein (capsule biosynthesis protein)